tara:strand:- start:6116 stop:7804 length:1689 start_codon:yes stop_codon:yes gene_type:complete
MYSGGYQHINEPFLKFSLNEHTSRLFRPVSDEILEVCDTLGLTALKINPFILKEIKACYEANESVGKVTYSDDEPLPPFLPDNIWDKMKRENDKAGIQKVKREREVIHSRNAKRKGQRWSLIRKIRLSDELGDKTFYLPHCIDFRGRVYPLPQDINFVNDDVSRALLRFAEGKPYTKSGFKWLCIKLANDFGMDKLTFEERLEWVQKNYDLILDSADNPRDGERFWTQADEAWQFLAGCEEFKRVDEEGIGVALNYIPVNVDATASGIQHLSAWIKCPTSAQVVNMTGNQDRFDIYGVQAESLARVVAKDIDNVEEAKNWHGHIDRKTVKRAIMTIPYSVTPQGIRDQFIADGHVEHLEGNPISNANYLRDALLSKESLGNTIDKPREVMAYFKEVAQAFAEFDIPVTFKTPMGMTVHQAYWRENRKNVNTCFGKATLVEEYEELGLKKHKQAQSIAPNIIHAFDAAHLQAVVYFGSRLKENPITQWACIHDSIGTYANDIDNLNEVIRETFVEIYSKDVLGDFHQQMIDNIPHDLSIELPEPPTQGTFDIREVLSAPYFFS